MQPNTIAAASISAVAFIILFMDWAPTSLNKNILKMSLSDRLPGTLIHLSTCLAFGTANIFAAKWVVALGAVWFSVVAAVAIINWWLPYFFNVAAGEITPEKFQVHYAANTRILPPIGGRVIVPDVQHMLIHGAVAFASVSSWWSFATGA